MNPRRGQAVVEVLALAPLVTACVLGFSVCAAQLAAMATAEAMLARAVAADAAGAPVAGPIRPPARVRILDGERIAIAVPAPLGDVTLSARRIP